MTLLTRLMDEHNAVVQYAQESHYKDGFLDGMKKAIDIVKNHNDWISVDDELPNDDNNRYLVYSIHTEVCEIVNKSQLKQMIDNSAKITHWQPLPKPPKEKLND